MAPSHCHVIRYQTKPNQKIYWDYKLQAIEPILPRASDDKIDILIAKLFAGTKSY